MIENKTTSDCTIYAFVSTAILAISLVVAMYVGNDFHQSLFVESIIFVGSNILLWAIIISMVNCPYELMTIVSNSKTKKNVVEAESATEQEQPMQTLPQTQYGFILVNNSRVLKNLCRRNWEREDSSNKIFMPVGLFRSLKMTFYKTMYGK